ncbi:MAG: ABC transporter ATP-binding protein/permease [Anaerolineales bacterium]|nr:ABC transporter ATP-binding protein/permease [Anaerolineales bacterium]
MKNVSRALVYLRHYWPTALGTILSLLLVTTANLITPQLLKVLIDDGIEQSNLKIVYGVAAALVGVAVVRGAFNFLQGYLSEITSQGVAYDLRNAIFEKLQNLSFSYHDRVQTGKLMTRMTSDVELVRIFVGNGLLQLISALVMLIGAIVIMFLMNWLLAIIILTLVPIILAVLFLFIRQVMPISRVVQQELGALNTILQENLAGLRVVKAFAREEYEIGRYRNKNEDLLIVNLDLVGIFTKYFPLLFFIANMGVVAVVWIGGLQVIGLQLTIGELVAFTGYLGFLLMPMFMIGMIGSMFSRAEASSQRLFEVVDAESEIQDKSSAVPLPEVQGKVEFENVSFRYFGSENNILREVSFTAEAGKTVAILGRTGSGKSTVINLIPRFYDVSDGSVIIDGLDVRDVMLDSLRAQIGIVLQETTLFSGSIAENIAYGKPDAQFEEIVSAAISAQAHEFITELPDGYETLVGERGVGLSGGEKQRIAIARALLVDPKILILDDSTSSVDAETEYKIQQALDLLMKNRTSFVIAQRISTVRNADLILLLDNQNLVAQGTHEELIQTSELYAEILATQFGDRSELIFAAEEEMKI